MITPKTFLMIAVVLTLGGFACQTTHATLIVGLLNISGSAPGPGGASGRPGFFGAAVDEGTNGSFNFMQTGAPVAIASPSMFFDSPVVAASLWSVGGFTLDLNFGHRTDDPLQRTITGTATIFAPRSSPTFGAQWTYISGIGGTFTFELRSTTLVTPDSSTTIVLLGVGLIAIASCRVKFAKS